MIRARLDVAHSGVACALAIVATLVAWGAVPWGAFQFDDFRNVVRDPATTDFAAFIERLPHGLRPLTRLSYFLDAQLYGLDATGFLTTNLLLHVVTVLLVFALARRRLDVASALIAALVFTIQPANAEVVAYVSGRSTGLMTPLLLGALLLHDQGRRLGAVLLFCLACLAKEHALVFVGLLLVWELTRDEPRTQVVRGILVTSVLAVALVAVMLGNEGYRSLLGDSLTGRPILETLLANARAVPELLSLWVRPWALSADHAFDPRLHIGASIAGLTFLSIAVTAAVVLRRRFPWLTLAIAWALIALLPTNSFLAKADFVTEKPLYLAWIGPALALGWGLPALFHRAPNRVSRRMFVGAAGLLLCALLGASLWRASLWRSPVALWSDAVAKAPQKSRCWNNLGMANLVAGHEFEAVGAFERALLLDPDNEYASTNLVTARVLCGPRCSSR